MTIKFKHAYKSFGNKIIFKDASININRNSIYFIMSPNGSGKTTVVDAIDIVKTIMAGDSIPEDSSGIFNTSEDYLPKITVEIESENNLLNILIK